MRRKYQKLAVLARVMLLLSALGCYYISLWFLAGIFLSRFVRMMSPILKQQKTSPYGLLFLGITVASLTTWVSSMKENPFKYIFDSIPSTYLTIATVAFIIYLIHEDWVYIGNLSNDEIFLYYDKGKNTEQTD